MKLIAYKQNEEEREFTMTVKMTEEEWKDFDPRAFEVMGIIERYELDTYAEPEKIQEIIYDHFKLTDSMKKKMPNAKEVGRIARFVEIRRICYYFMREFTPLSYPSMGKLYGQDHATVMHHKKKIDGWVEVDPQYRDNMREIRLKIANKLKLKLNDKNS